MKNKITVILCNIWRRACSREFRCHNTAIRHGLTKAQILTVKWEKTNRKRRIRNRRIGLLPSQCVTGEIRPSRFFPSTRLPRGLTFSWWGCYGLCLGLKPTEVAHSFLFCSCIYFCLYGPFNCISFHKFSRQLSVFWLCSSGLVCLPCRSFQLHMKASFSPGIIHSGWLGATHQLTNWLAN